MNNFFYISCMINGIFAVIWNWTFQKCLFRAPLNFYFKMCSAIYPIWKFSLNHSSYDIFWSSFCIRFCVTKVIFILYLMDSYNAYVSYVLIYVLLYCVHIPMTNSDYLNLLFYIYFFTFQKYIAIWVTPKISTKFAYLCIYFITFQKYNSV